MTTKKSPPTSKRPRWQSFLGTALVLLIVIFVYWQTGTVPDELLEGVLGTDAATVSAILQQTATPQPTETSIPTDTPTVVGIIEQAPTPTATDAPVSTPIAVSTATKKPTPTPTVTPTSTATRRATSTPTTTRLPTRAPPTATATATRIQSGLPYVLYNELPTEAQETIRLIDNNGPFPFRQDDATFQNREGILPRQPRDWYREFTVITPGSRDRGARRIVEGEDGVLFYTDDHYDSFREVIR